MPIAPLPAKALSYFIHEDSQFFLLLFKTIGLLDEDDEKYEHWLKLINFDFSPSMPTRQSTFPAICDLPGGVLKFLLT
jgi:hypothetical protein